MFTTFSSTYANYRWLRIASALCLLVCVGLLSWLSGGFPPWSWRFLAHVIFILPALWTTHGLRIVVPFIGLVLNSAFLLILWIALLSAIIKLLLYQWRMFQERQHTKQEAQEIKPATQHISAKEQRVAKTARYSDDYDAAAPTIPLSAQSSTYDALPDTIYPRMPSSARRYTASPVNSAQSSVALSSAIPARASARSTAVYEPMDRQEHEGIQQYTQDVSCDPDEDIYDDADFSDESDEDDSDMLATANEDDFAESNEEEQLVFEQAEKATIKPNGTSAKEPRQLRLVVGIESDPGRTRKDAPNEDDVLGLQGTQLTASGRVSMGLFVVADGMGGHSNGQKASRAAIRSMSDVVTPVMLDSKVEEASCVRLLQEGVQRANLSIYQHNTQHQMMGTTITTTLIFGATAHIVNVGDSRTYLYRPSDGLTQITRDHSYVARLVEQGTISRQDIYTHAKRNVIERCLGSQEVVELDSFTVPLQANDVLLLCSDGLWEMVRDPEIERIVKHNAPHASQTSEKLIEAALRNGGTDNVSAIVVCVIA